MRFVSTLLAFLLATFVNAQNIVNVSDYGVVPDSRINVVPALKEAIKACEGKENPVLLFPKGRYDFWPSTLEIPYLYDQTIPIVPENVGIALKGIDNLTIDGDGSEFIFHSYMQIMSADSCSNLTVRDFSVDWDRPMISQCDVRKIGPSFVDVYIDRREYPYIVDNGKLKFIGEGWEETSRGVLLWFNNIYDKDSKEIKYNTWDSPFASKDLFARQCEELPNGNIRLYGTPPEAVDEGDILTIFHSFYTMFGLRFTNCKDLLLKDLSIYHALGYGVSCERCENITLDNANMTVNESKGRVFSVTSDACNFTNCKGLAKLINVSHTGHSDDWLNIHSAYAVISSIENDRTVKITEEYPYTGPGDEVWFIDRSTSGRKEIRVVESVEQLPTAKSDYQPFPTMTFLIKFTEPLPERIVPGDFFENKTYTCDLEMRDCKVLRRHRARGVLFTTAGKALIENNYFASAGTAILINGDTDRWYEGGGCEDVTIRGNIFDNCLTSGNRDGDRHQWGEAVITIMPSFNTVGRNDETYHKHIHINDNIFRTFDAPLVLARSTRDLQFMGNTIIKTYDYKPYAWQRSAFMLDGCREVKIIGNSWDNAYQDRLIQYKNMIKSDMKVKDKGFVLEKLPNDFKTYLEW